MTAVSVDHLSHSQIQEFTGCPRKWVYSHVHRVERERTGVALVFGSAIHAGVAEINEAAFSGEQRPTLSFSTLVSSELAAASAPVDDPEALVELQITGQTLLDSYHAPPGIIGVEQAFDVVIDDALPPVTGRIDLIRRLDTGGLAIADVKTSASKVISDTSAVEAQLGLYDIAYPAEAHEAIVMAKLKKPVISTQSIRAWSQPRLVNQYAAVYKAMVAGIDYPVTGWHCAGCQYRDRCRRDCGARS